MKSPLISGENIQLATAPHPTTCVFNNLSTKKTNICIKTQNRQNSQPEIPILLLELNLILLHQTNMLIPWQWLVVTNFTLEKSNDHFWPNIMICFCVQAKYSQLDLKLIPTHVLVILPQFIDRFQNANLCVLSFAKSTQNLMKPEKKFNLNYIL